MKYLADENFPHFALQLPRQSAFDVVAVAETVPGLADSEVLAVASAEGRTLLTFDKDFGELAFRRGLPAACGVILFRTASLTPTQAAELALATLQSGAAWAGHFSVISDARFA